MRAKETLELLQVHRVTLNRYVREGTIRVTKLSNVDMNIMMKIYLNLSVKSKDNIILK